MRRRRNLALRPDILDLRRETVGPPFGSIKQWRNRGTFLIPGQETVEGEFSLTVLACNLRRVINLVDVSLDLVNGT